MNVIMTTLKGQAAKNRPATRVPATLAAPASVASILASSAPAAPAQSSSFLNFSPAIPPRPARVKNPHLATMNMRIYLLKSDLTK